MSKPMGNPRQPNMARPMQKARKGTFKRLIGYVTKYYKKQFLLVLFCILFSALATSLPGIFQQNVLSSAQDGYYLANPDKIEVSTEIKEKYPDLTYEEQLIKEKENLLERWALDKTDLDNGGLSSETALNTVLPSIINTVLVLIVVYIFGLMAAFTQTRTMAVVTQGFLHKMRILMFGKMQSLPIKYFDTHKHGDIMSHYTNDIDTLRQLVSQAIPQLITSCIIIFVVSFIMLFYSVWLTLVVVFGVILMLIATKKIGGSGAKYFISQQKSLGISEGYIEEMINGQKVVKVFNHEPKTKEEFNRLNTQLCEDSTKANKFANTLMPIINNLGHILYVLLVLVGSMLIYFKVPNLSLSGKELDVTILIPFLGMSKQFTNNISQLSQQANAIIMGLAGADRVFELLDEESEVDNGYVTLVNATTNDKGEIVESEKRTGMWAWKHPHGDGTITYTELKGDVRLNEVDFGYTEEKIVLHDISIYAEPGQKIAFVGAVK